MSPGVLVVLLATAANAAYLPPGAVLRFGDDRWRAGGRVDALVFSPNGKMFATTERAGGVVSLKVWDADTGRPTREARLNDDLFCGFAWGNNGGFAVVRRVDRDARGRGTLVPDDFVVWDFTDPYAFPPPLFDRIHYCTSGPQADIVRPQTRERFIGFAVAASGNRIVAFRELRGKEFPTVEVYELTATSSATRLTRASLPADVQVVSQGWLSANGRVLVTYSDGDSDSETRTALWPLDLSSGKEWRFIQIPGRAKEVAISADGSTLAAANHKRCDVITLIDLKTGKKRADLPYPKPLYRGDSDHDLLAFSPDAGRLLITVSRGAAVLDVATGKERGRLEGHAAELSAFAFSPDGKRIATADENGLIRLWDAVTLRPLNEPTGHRAEVRFARLSPDGKRLLTWAKDETARVWDMTTGKELRAFGSVCAPTFTPDWLAVVVSTRERLMIRDVVTGSEVPLPEGMSKHPAAGAVFAPDGKALLTYPASGESLTVWDWPSGSRRLAVIKPPGNDQYDPEPIRDPGFSSDSALVFSAIDNPNRWDARTGKHRTIA
jgi:WD40 repeat protein